MKTLTRYMVKTDNGKAVCGPFRNKINAQSYADDYGKSPFWGPCHVVELHYIPSTVCACNNPPMSWTVEEEKEATA